MRFRTDAEQKMGRNNGKRIGLSWLAVLVTAGQMWMTESRALADDVVYLKQPVFQIPIQIASSRVAEITELHLFVSTDRGQTWQKVRTAKPSQQAFTFRAQADGEYWFSLAYVDRSGKVEPSDVRAEPPGLKVVLDTRAPTVVLQPMPREGGHFGVSWNMNDEKLDVESLVIEVKGDSDTDWRDVRAPKMSEGQGQWVGNAKENYSVRATIRDRAGNVSVARVEIPAEEKSFAAAATAAPSTATPVSSTPETASTPRALDFQDTQYSVPPPPRREPVPIPRATPGPMEENYVQRGPESANDYATAPRQWTHTVQRPIFDRDKPDLPADARPGSGIQQVNAERTPATAATEAQRRSAIASTAQPAPRPNTPAAAPEPEKRKIRLSNTNHFAVDYHVRGVGPSGVGKVELYYTTDNGQKWTLLGEDQDRQPPFEVTLPNDGRYGLTVVVKSPAGFGQRPPKEGDQPQMIVEIDTTPPEAEMYQPIPDPNSSDDSLLISWSSRDLHLSETPVSLYFAEYPEGPWYSIKAGLASTGQYSWRVPANIPHQVYLRLMATDLGNNVSVADTPKPVIVDLARPEADVIGILPDNRMIR
ncbi:MAG: hypothetical protein U1D30_19900 [Planctomycetota bacterium]